MQRKPSDEPEKKLHNEISRLLNERRILFFHGSTAHKTKRTLGEPDYIIALPKGETLWIECKTRKRKASPEQVIIKHRLQTAGHAHYLIRSLSEFTEILNNYLSYQ